MICNRSDPHEFFVNFIFNCFLFVLLGIVTCSNAVSETLTGTVFRVHDGDTITIQTDSTSKKIRLAGIDAPELKQPQGIESRAALSQEILNQQITVVTSKTDKYGRSVGKVLVYNEDINLKQLKKGLAWVYADYIKELTVEDRGLYKAAEDAARSERLGIWQDDLPVSPWIYRKTK